MLFRSERCADVAHGELLERRAGHRPALVALRMVPLKLAGHAWTFSDRWATVVKPGRPAQNRRFQLPAQLPNGRRIHRNTEEIVTGALGSGPRGQWSAFVRSAELEPRRTRRSFGDGGRRHPGDVTMRSDDRKTTRFPAADCWYFHGSGFRSHRSVLHC